MKPLLILIDGANMAHRFRHVHTLRTSKNRSTGVLYGMLNAITTLANDYVPDEIVVCHDPMMAQQQRSWRYSLFPEYKSARKQRHEHADEEEKRLLSEFYTVQIPDTLQALAAFGIPQYQVDGLEADDLIAAHVHRAKSLGGHALIISTDRDMLQLAEQYKCRVLNPTTHDMYYQDSAGALRVSNAAEPIAVHPKAYLTKRILSGDSSDSIPGVKGIGEKRATALINEYWQHNPSDDALSFVQGAFRCADLTTTLSRQLVHLKDHVATIARNQRLMELAPLSVDQCKALRLLRCEYTIDKLTAICNNNVRKLLCSERPALCEKKHFGVFIKPNAEQFGSPIYRFFMRREFDFIAYPDRVCATIETFRALHKRQTALYVDGNRY